MTSFSIQSFGCRVNQAEAFAWANTLQSHGLVYRSEPLGGDIVLVNTCTLTSRADRDVRNFLNKLARANPDARVVVTGCYSERVRDDLFNRQQVWKVFANAEKEDLPARILEGLDSGERTHIRPFRSRALVKIQDGCDFRCSFCIIPDVRGKSRSLPREKILAQVREYVRQGYKEIVLTGIHLCSYGKDRPKKDTLVGLLHDLEGIKGLGRVRLSSLDPRFLDQDLCDCIAGSPVVCPHFHISLQHGSDDVLRLMRRKISVADYRRKLDDIYRRVPGVSLGADIIVGFPGETKKDFESLCDFLDRSPLSYFHVFSYSPRPGTPAAVWEQVGENIKKERAARLRALSKKKNLDFRHKLLGSVWDGIVIKQKNGFFQILTSNYVSVRVPSCSAGERGRVSVKITGISGNTTTGHVVA
jgi:threonylcarbamoyladenosine tRNA methylthiotransferase MtaB